MVNFAWLFCSLNLPSKTQYPVSVPSGCSPDFTFRTDSSVSSSVLPSHPSFVPQLVFQPNHPCNSLALTQLCSPRTPEAARVRQPFWVSVSLSPAPVTVSAWVFSHDRWPCQLDLNLLVWKLGCGKDKWILSFPFLLGSDCVRFCTALGKIRTLVVFAGPGVSVSDVVIHGKHA